MRILLLEDDPLIGDGLKVGLSKLGFAIDWFSDGLTGQEALFSVPYDAVILDLGLSGIDGIDILKHWRENGKDTPVLILSARIAVEHRVEGLLIGADDYLCKPFALIEVSARLRALNRRSNRRLEPLIRYGDLTYDPIACSLERGGEKIELTPRELALLELFLNNENRVLSKKTIREKLYTWDDEMNSNAIEVHIHHLRRKLGNDIVRTVHGVGYVLGETE